MKPGIPVKFYLWQQSSQRKPHKKLCPGAWLPMNTLKGHNYRGMWASGPPVHSSSAWLPRWTTIDRRLPHGTFNFWDVLSYVPHGSVDPSEMALGGLFRLTDGGGVIY